MKLRKYILLIAYGIQLTACSVNKEIGKQAQKNVIGDSLLLNAHVGICVYDATDGKYLYNYQGDKYFIPASNTKIFTCYAAMKYLGDSLVGLRYKIQNDSTILIEATGDPSFLHPDFKVHPVYNFLKDHKAYPVELYMQPGSWNEDAWGTGWSWDDYYYDYMAERSPFPIYGNLVRFEGTGKINAKPTYFLDSIIRPTGTTVVPSDDAQHFSIQRLINANQFVATGHPGNHFLQDVPFVTNAGETAVRLLRDTLDKTNIAIQQDQLTPYPSTSFVVIHSQPTDSLLKILMHRSDNFYAEQSLLMVSNEKLGIMNDEKIIDTLLKTDLKDLPQHPRWVDGSGLSRFNLITPQDFVFMLNKIRNEFAWNRITTIFSTGGDGTIGNYYKGLRGKIYAKTGSLSNNTALSGYLITQKNKLLIFSVLVNNHTTSASGIRRAVERFITTLQKEY